MYFFFLSYDCSGRGFFVFFRLFSFSSRFFSVFFFGVIVVIKLVWEMFFVVAYWLVLIFVVDIEFFMYILWFLFIDVKSKYN